MHDTTSGSSSEEDPIRLGSHRRKHGAKTPGQDPQMLLDLPDCTPQKRSPLEQALADSREQCRRLREQLDLARRAAQAADRAKTDFLALMNHEVRTPMNGIVALVELLNRCDTPTAQQQEYLNGLLASSDNLLQIINNIIDYSQLRSGDLALEPEDFSPVALVEDATAPLMKALREKELSYIQKIDQKIPPLLRGDRRRIGQIIRNLLSNAVKFTDRGNVELALRLVEQTRRHAVLELVVSDNGNGIPPGLREKIFEPFVQADSSSTRKWGGAGLGLTIARRLAELMKGTLVLEEQVEPGSRFRCTLPLQKGGRGIHPEPGPGEEQGDLLKWGGRSLHILLAEDHDVNRQLTEKILVRLGHTVRAASNGKIAVEISADESFDLILMDMEMPEMDGWQAASLIRKREGDGRHVPIIAVTAHALKGSRGNLPVAGFDGYLSKPIDFLALTKEMQRLAAR